MKKYIPIIIWVVALGVIACALLLFERDQLWKVQQMNLFLNSMMFLKEQTVVAGGFLTWVGMWFTQFLYYPWLGVGLLCGWWLVLLLLMKKTFQTPSHRAVVLLAPVALLLLTNMDLGYWIYILKLHGYFFVTTIGTTTTVALLWGFRTISNKWLYRGLFMVATCGAGYPLAGIYGLAATLLMGLWAWKLTAKRSEAIVLSGLAVVCILAVPLLCYRLVYYQMNLANIWWAELPLFFTTEEYHGYYIPYYLLLAFFVFMVLTYKENHGDGDKNHGDKNHGDSPRVLRKLRTQGTVPMILLQAVVMVAGVWYFWFKDENFHHELRMQHQIDRQDWAGVLEEAATQECEPTRAIVMMRNLALTRLGRQGDEMFLYRNGSRRYEAPFDMRLMLVAGPLIYYQYGMLNSCNRLCMEMGVEFGFCINYYQLLTNCAILDNDGPLARKYIGILKQTSFYRDWAKRAERLPGHPELTAKDEERGPVTHMLHYDNYLGGDQGYTERFVMSQLARSVYTGDPIFQEQTLLATLWTRDIKLFWHHFRDYIRLHPDGPIPRYYQEAAYLYGKLEDRKDLDRMPFDAGVKETFERFADSASNYDGEDIKTAQEALYPFYGQTYYYDYVTMSELPEY